MENSAGPGRARTAAGPGALLMVLVTSCLIHRPGVPPSLMDDVDGVQAQIARTMLESGDWVTAHLNGIAYLEKSPLIYWLMAISYSLFGVSDVAAKSVISVGSVALCWLTYRIGRWAFGEYEGRAAGLVLGTCIGLWLFTRILIPDVLLTGTIALALWAFLRALEPDEAKAGWWAAVFAAAIGTGMLLKGLIAALFPVAIAGVYLVVTGQLLEGRTWQRLRPFTGMGIIALIAGPWHVLATLRNPPYLDLTPRSEPGQYHGFFWFYFLNEHVFRFLNMRHPRDYNTVPRHLFWLFHLLWFFPWSAYLPGVVKLAYKPEDRGGRMRLLALCWIGFTMLFFTFSTTQEYYSMPIYPAVALLLGFSMSRESRWNRAGSVVLGSIGLLAACAIVYILSQVWNLPTPGDISNALVIQDYEAYTLSLGHMGDLTMRSFAYLRTPLVLAGVAFVLLAAASWLLRRKDLHLGLALSMVVFLTAARMAMGTFDPYLSSRGLAEALVQAPAGRLIADNQYYTFSSVFFYAGAKASRPEQRALLLNGRVNNLEYGSYAPGAPQVFVTDEEFSVLWRRRERYYLLLEGPELPRIERLVGRERLHVVKAAGGKYLLTNDADLH